MKHTTKASRLPPGTPPPPLNPKVKARLAQEIFDQVQSEGGRFLRVMDVTSKDEGSVTTTASGSSVQHDSDVVKKKNNTTTTGSGSGGPTKRTCFFVKVPDLVAVDKIKQSFRHQRRLLSSPTPSASSGLSVHGTKIPPPSNFPADAESRDNIRSMSVIELLESSVEDHNKAGISPLDVPASMIFQSGLSSHLGGASSLNPKLDALTAAALDLERMKQDLEAELLLTVQANHLTANRDGYFPTHQSNIFATDTGTTAGPDGHVSSLLHRLLFQQIHPTTLLGATSQTMPTTNAPAPFPTLQQNVSLVVGNTNLTPPTAAAFAAAAGLGTIRTILATSPDERNHPFTHDGSSAPRSFMPSTSWTTHQQLQQQQQQQQNFTPNIAAAQNYLNIANELLRNNKSQYPKNA
jgi:hypothetical protein